MVGTIFVAQPCEGDLTGNGVVDGDDLLIVLAHWGSADTAGDADGDGTVDGEDLLVVLGDWGDCD